MCKLANKWVFSKLSSLTRRKLKPRGDLMYLSQLITLGRHSCSLSTGWAGGGQLTSLSVVLSSSGQFVQGNWSTQPRATGHKE